MGIHIPVCQQAIIPIPESCQLTLGLSEGDSREVVRENVPVLIIGIIHIINIIDPTKESNILLAIPF